MATTDKYQFAPEFEAALQTTLPNFQAQQMSPSAIERAGYYGLTAPAAALEGLQTSVSNLTGFEAEPLIPDEYRIPAGTTTAQKVTDFIGGGLLPMGLQLATTGGLGGAGLKFAGMKAGTAGYRTAQEAINFGLLGGMMDRPTAAQQTVEGAAVGYTTAKLAKSDPRRWAIAAALGLASKEFFDRNGEEPVYGDFSMGDVAGVATALSTALIGKPVKPFRSPLPDHFTPYQHGAFGQELVPVTPGPTEVTGPTQHINPQPTNPVFGPGMMGPDGIVYGTPNTLRPPLALPEGTPPPAQPLLAVGGADRPFSYMPDMGVDQSMQQVLNRMPWRHQVQTPPFHGDMTPTPVMTDDARMLAAIFDPKNRQWIQELGANPNSPEVQAALQRLQIALLTRDARMDVGQRQMAFAKFVAEIHNRPDVTSLQAQGALAGDDAFAQMIQQGTRQPANPLLGTPEFPGQIYSPSRPPEPMLNPLPEGDLIGAAKSRTPPFSQAEVQQMLKDLPEQIRSRDEFIMEMEREAARRGKPPLSQAERQMMEMEFDRRQNVSRDAYEQIIREQQDFAARGRIPDLPEYMRTEGGGIAPEMLRALGMAGVRAGVGATAGATLAELDGNPETDAMSAMALGAAVGILAPLAPAALAQLQSAKMARKAGVSRPFGQAPDAMERGAINLGSPLRTQFEAQAKFRSLDDPNVNFEFAPIAKIGSRDVSYIGMMNEIGFKKAASISNAELDLYKRLYPSAFKSKGQVHVRALYEEMKAMPPFKVQELSIKSENTAGLKLAQDQARIQHELETIGYYPTRNSQGQIEVNGVPLQETNLSSAERQKIKEYFQIADDLDKVTLTPQSRAASAEYPEVNPLPPPVLRGEQLTPTGGKVIWAGDVVTQLNGPELFRSYHYSGEASVNNFAFVRMYVEELPDGTRRAHIYEVQSDWASELAKGQDKIKLNHDPEIQRLNARLDKAIEVVRKFEDFEYDPSQLPYKETTSTPQELYRRADAIRYKLQEKLSARASEVLGKKIETHLVRHYIDESKRLQSFNLAIVANSEEIGLKNAIRTAIKQGADEIVISDAKTAMMTERHDQAITITAPDLAPYIDDMILGSVPVGKWIVYGKIDGKKHMQFKPTEIQAKTYVDFHNELKYTTPGRGYELQTRQITKADLGIKQEKGMIAAYDERLPYTMEKWTGKKGRPIRMGQHQNAVGETGVIGSPYIRDIDGKPKTEITARAWPADIFKLAIAENAFPLRGKPVPEGMKRAGRTGGFVMPEMSAALGRAGIGGLVGGVVGGMTDERNDYSGFIAGAVIGAGIGMFGPSLVRAVNEAIGRGTITPPSGKSMTDAANDLARNWGAKVEEYAGAAFRGSDHISERFVRKMDQWFEITMPLPVKEALLKSRGIASHLLDRVDNAMMKMSLRYQPDDVVKQTTNRYLDGQLSTTAYLQQLQSHIANNPNVKHYAEFAIQARSSIDGLQRMVAEGVGNPKMKKIIMDSLGKYTTRSYRLFTDPRWKPDAAKMDALAKDILQKKIWPNATYDDVRTYLEQYVREMKTAKGAYQQIGNPVGQAIGQAVLKERKQLGPEWKAFLGEITDPTERIYQTVMKLRPMAEASKYMADVAKVSDDGLPQVFSGFAAKDAFMDQLLQQLQTKYSSNQQVAQLITDYRNAQGNRPEIRTKLMRLVTNDADNQRTFKHLASLDSYQNVEAHPKFGALQGQTVSRSVWDTLQTFDSITDAVHHPWLSSIAGMHTAIKLGRTALNPITVVRNMVTMPAFMVIGRANISDVPESMAIIRNANHPLRREIMEQGISNVDQVKTEFYKEFLNATGGRFNFGTLDLANLQLRNYDLNVMEKAGRRGLRNVLDFYRLPDNVVRISTYLSAKRRIAQALGKSLDDPEVITQATRFTNRYTMNYDAIVPAIKSIRQYPIVNLFISYQAEMARLAKNLVEDVIQGNMLPGGGVDLTRQSRLTALIPLAGLAVVPEILQSNSEAQLSPQDRRDWEKTKALLPDYGRTRYYAGLHRDRTGQFQYLDITPLIASDSMNQLVRAVTAGDWSAAAATNPVLSWTNTPALNIVLSQASGKDIHTKREFRYGEQGFEDRFASVAKEVLPPWVPSVGSESRRWSQAYSENKVGELGITDKLGRKLTPQDFWMPYFSGIKPGSANLSSVQQRAVSEAKHLVANEVRYANDILKSDASDELKERELEKTRLAIATIREALLVKLQGLPEQSFGAKTDASSPRQ